MAVVYFVNLNWVLIIISVICAAFSIQEYKKAKGTMSLLSAVAWILVAGLSALGLWAQ